ncbi:MAG TPA: protein kinase [Candidatus Krumholzibacteria bacterium]
MIGSRLAHYEITAKIGQGGMGEVYRARDTRLDREVALKLLPDEFARDSERVARFHREATVLACLNHANIAAIYGLEEDGERIFLVMELVDGEELGERITRGPLPLEDVLEIAFELSEGLEAAHEAGVVHRDLKPANLKLTPNRQLKILDFGLARAYQGDGADAGDLRNSPTITAALTQQGVILGTAAYMSPEQARGHRLDRRSDIWSFGAILFEMLGGKRLFEGETVSDTVAAVLRADLPWEDLGDELPRGLRRLLERCLERDPRRRLRDIGEARLLLERWRDDPASIHETYTRVDSAVSRAPSPRSWIPWLVSVLLLAPAFYLGMKLAPGGGQPVQYVELEIDVPGEASIPPDGRNNVLLSPDGERMAWITDQAIYVRELGDREVRKLEGTGAAIAACFSPDSRWIAFVARQKLQRISVTGGTPFELFDDVTARGCAWVDESTIVFPKAIASGLVVLSLESGEVSELTTPSVEKGERSHRWPTAVPGRRAVVFMCQYLGRDYDESDIQYVSLDGGERQTIHRGGAAPRVTKDGALLFVRGSTLYAVEFDAAVPATKGMPVILRDNLATSVGNQENDDGSAQFALSDTGTLLYLDQGTLGQERSQLAWFDLTTGGIERFGVLAHQHNLSISPDGRFVTLARLRDGHEDLYVHEFATGTETQLTLGSGVEYVGSWDPRAEYFYWTQGSADADNFEIWRRRADGSEAAAYVAELPPGGGGASVSSISDDGTTLLGNSWEGVGRNEIFSLDLGAPETGVQWYLRGPDDDTNARFIGDGLVFYSVLRDGYSFDLRIRRFPDSGALWTFAEGEGGYFVFGWSREASGAYAIDREGVVFLPVELNSGTPRIGIPQRLVEASAASRSFSVRSGFMPRNGNRMLLLLYEESAEATVQPTLVLITGWGQRLQPMLSFGR